MSALWACLLLVVLATRCGGKTDEWGGSGSEEVDAVGGTLALPESSQECHEQHPAHPEQRVCVMKNLLLWDNTVYYISRKPITIAPFFIAWERKFDGDDLLPIKVISPAARPRGLAATPPLHRVALAGLFHQQHHENHYHLFAEIAPTLHYILCKYLNRCRYQKHDLLHLFWVNDLSRRHALSQGYLLPPAIKELFQCLTGSPVKNIYNATVGEGRALLLETAVVGLPRNVRFYHQKRPEWKERFQDPPPLEYMQSYRRRIADCLGYNFVDAPVPTNPLRVTFVNRHYDDGRAILNAEAIKNEIRRTAVPPGLGGVEVEILYLEGTLREQAAQIWNSSVLIWAHGSAMAQTFFLPRGAQAIEVVQWVVEDPGDQHVWVTGIRSSFGLDIGLDVVVNDDKTKTFFNFDMIRAPHSQYHRFNDSEKVALLEDRQCPEVPYASGAECFGWAHWGMSLVLKFDLLKPALDKALAQLAEHAMLLVEQQQQEKGAGREKLDEPRGGEAAGGGAAAAAAAAPEGQASQNSAAAGSGYEGSEQDAAQAAGEEEQASPGEELPMRR